VDGDGGRGNVLHRMKREGIVREGELSGRNMSREKYPDPG